MNTTKLYQYRNPVVAFLRVIALLFILMHHCQLMYWGWPPFDWGGCVLCSSDWEDMLSVNFKMFGLGMFAFLSGYVLYYQKNKQQNFLTFLWLKTKRLVIPCLFFAFVYRLLFPSMMESEGAVNGTHLWFIPMIFLCIILTSIQVFNTKLGWLCVLIYLFCVKFRLLFDSRTLTEFIKYFPIFYLGFYTHAFEGEKMCNNGSIFRGIWKYCVVFVSVCFILLGSCQIQRITHHIINCISLLLPSISVGIVLFFVFFSCKYVRSTIRAQRGGYSQM